MSSKSVPTDGTLVASRDRGFALHLDPKVWSAFRAAGESLSRVPQVPVHPDPNRKNFLVSADSFVMVDWDDVTLSDPLWDVGLLLWWYVPRQRWPAFFSACGIRPDGDTYARIHWWAASTSLMVALWLAEHGLGEKIGDFLDDFSAAARGRDNPHAAAG